ncbi:integrin alpha-PS2 isoform X2 [Chrysoperla carnea]|uniref:integrin alpha-PS2 isoform X2 n=1 Tax=Chrysoperla carnea TaxID=189513 RepID=UPI001D083D04|nr:integrin alpha-PS2 isoform X2 [Chrysoperla carnea]
MSCFNNSVSVKVNLIFIIGALLLVGAQWSNCFNVDIEHFTKHHGPSNSMFGFSVALHRFNGASWVIVGAPEAETTQPGVVRGGAVYRCSVVSESCQELPFDRKGHNNNSQDLQIDIKSRQWFGATVNSAGIDGPVVACAPRYVWFSTSLQRRDPVGTCYVATGDFATYAEYSPCRTRQWGYHRQGSCQAGLGAALAQDGHRLFIGAPGSWYWQGQLFGQNLDSRKNVYQTAEGPAQDDDSYLGYSVAAGVFGDDAEEGVAVGMPRGAGLYGKVLLFTWDMENLQNITGEQLGAYFGYAIAVADVDGDDADDLIIGAPMYTDLANNEGKYETGRVYVIYRESDEGLYRKIDKLDGLNSKARFGLALTRLGDINLDTYGDFAVGAPYDGEYGQGAVYIYHGSAKGVREKPSQVIFAQQLGDPSLQTFGFSLSGGIDVDNNEYPDLVVGAYESNRALLFRSRPVVKMDAVVSFNAQNKQINIEERNCTIRRLNEKVACTSINVCMEFKGIGVQNMITLNVQYVLDSKKLKNPRMFFLPNENNIVNETITLEHSKKYCKSMDVFVKNGVRDKLTPLEAEMRYSLYTDRRERNQYFQYDRERELTPVLDDSTGLLAKDSISIQKNCGPDNICIPDLRLIASPSVNKFVLGSNEKLKIDVEVQNEGEDAFEAMFNMKIPEGVNFTKIERLDSSKADIPVTCSAPSSANNRTLKCDIGNPLPRDKLVHFNVVLELETKPSYDFYINVNSTNPENNNSVSDNFKHISVGILVETHFSIDGTSRNQEILFNSSQYTDTVVTEESQLGPQVIHIYTIRNNGPSDIEEAELFFVWPMKTFDDETLLYMLDEPETAGPIRCDYNEFINEKNLKLEGRKSYLESNGILTGALTSSFSRQVGSSGIRFEDKITDGSRKVTGTASGNRILTPEERRRLDEDEFREDSGDASLHHIERNKQKVSSSGGTVVNDSYYRSTSGSRGSHTESGSHQSQGGRGFISENNYGTQSGTNNAQGGQENYISSSGGQRIHGGGYVQGGTQRYNTGGGYQVGSNAQGGRESHHITTSGSESSQGHRGSGVSGGKVITHTYETRWNSSQINGGPIQNTTWSRNWTTGPDGVIRHSEVQSGGHSGGHANFGVGSSDIRHSIYYSSSRAGSKSGSGTATSSQTGSASNVENSKWNNNLDRSGANTQNVYVETSTWSGRSKDGKIQWSGSSTSSHHESPGSSGSGLAINAGGRQIGSSSNTGTEYQSGSGGASGKVEYHKETQWSGFPQNTYQSGRTGQSSTSNSGNQNQWSSGGVQSGQWSGSGQHQEGSVRVESGEYHSKDFEEEASKKRNLTAGHFQWNGQTRGRDGREYQGQIWTEEQVNANLGPGISSGTYSSEGGTSGEIGIDNSRKEHRTSSSTSSERGFSNSRNQHRNSGGEISVAGGSTINTLNRQGSHSQSGGRNRSTYGVYNQREYDPNLGLGNAALGGGFRTQTLDLGILGSTGTAKANTQTTNTGGSRDYNQNSGGSIQYGQSYSGNSGERIEQSGEYDPDLGYVRTSHRSNQGGNSQQERSQSSSTSYISSSSHKREGADFYSSGQHFDSNKNPTNYGQHSSRQYSYSKEYSYGDNPTNRNRRSKRQISNEYDNDEYLKQALSCKATQCAVMRCVVSPLMFEDNNREAWIVFRGRANATTIRKLGGSNPVILSTMMVARVSKLPYIGKPDDQPIKSHEVFTTIVSKDIDTEPDVVPLWVVVLSAVAGALILLLLIYLLYVMGFFKRNRPNDAPERQPLNRNGHYQNGDEQL